MGLKRFTRRNAPNGSTCESRECLDGNFCSRHLSCLFGRFSRTSPFRIPGEDGQVKTSTKLFSVIIIPCLVAWYSQSAIAQSSDAPFTFDTTGSLNIGRLNHSATLLPNGKVLIAGGSNTALSRARNCTTRRAELGGSQAASTPAAMGTARRCCPTARSSLRGVMIAISMLSRAQNCTTRRAGPGRPPAA